MTLLVFGASGTLGRQIVKCALDEGYNVKCVVRNLKKAYFLKEWGAELIYGDLGKPETIPSLLIGVTVVIDAATTRPEDSYNSYEIDLQGKKILIEAAVIAKIERFIFFSITNANQHQDVLLMNFKVYIENKIKESGIPYIIFQLSGFFQGLINQYAIPILDNQSILLTGESTRISYIDTQDVAKLTIRSLSITKLKDQVIQLGGDYAWNSYEIIKLCENLSGQKAKIINLPLLFLKIMRQLTSFFDWTSNISDRLAFAEVLASRKDFEVSLDLIKQYFNNNEIQMMTLEKYLEEYFTRIMKKFKSLNFEQYQQRRDISF